MLFEKIKEWCKENNMPICELEKMCGLSKGTIGRWRKSYPRMNSLTAVSKVTGIKPSEFFQADKEQR